MYWRTHPRLRGRFQPDFPDDLQVLVHDGGPRITLRQPELVWVRVTGGGESDVFTGLVLNQPQQLSSVKKGQQIRFMVPSGGEYPILIREKYLVERPLWTIHPCQKCGFSEMFDPPSDLIQFAFPKLQAGAVVDIFTATCPLCGGIQTLEYKEPTSQRTT